jgi:hypothetical protein
MDADAEPHPDVVAGRPTVAEEALRQVSAADSAVQREAETVAVAELGRRLHVRLVPERLHLSDGTYVDVDGVSHDPPILVEVWAHQGPPKSAQRNKVLSDALKLIFATTLLEGRFRRVLCFTDERAAEPFRGRSWYASALRYHAVEIAVVELTDDWRQRILEAQARQYR